MEIFLQNTNISILTGTNNSHMSQILCFVTTYDTYTYVIMPNYHAVLLEYFQRMKLVYVRVSYFQKNIFDLLHTLYIFI